MKNKLLSEAVGPSLSELDEVSQPLDVDFLGIQHSSNSGTRQDGSSVLTDLIRLVSPDSSLGVLDWAFGVALTPIQRLLDSGKFRLVRTHFFNGPGVRNGRAASYEPTSGLNIRTFEAKVLAKDKKLLKHLTDRVKAWANLMDNYPEVQWYVSHTLEHNLSHNAVKILVDTIHKATKVKLVIVNNASHPTPANLHVGWVKEDHGQGPWESRVKLSSTDGLSIEDVTVPSWKNNVRRHLFKGVWTKFFNGRHSGEWEDPRSRTAWPSVRELEQALHVTDTHQSAPTVPPAALRGVKPTKLTPTSREIWKVLADDHGVPDPRKNLPVAIFKGDQSNYRILSARGHNIATLTFFGAYEEDRGLNRYYSGHTGGSKLTGLEIQRKAEKVAGSPWVYATNGKVAYGPFLPGQRQGKSRP